MDHHLATVRAGTSASPAIPTRSRAGRGLIGAVALAALLAPAALPATPSAAGLAREDGAVAEELPDLVQAPPSRLRVLARRTSRGRRVLLGFRSAVENVGEGPLMIRGRRIGRSKRMVADQVIRRPGARPRVVPGVGRLRFEANEDHSHWHYVRFERYRLTTDAGRRVGADRKSGFCLGDRFSSPRVPPASRQAARFQTRCGLGARRLRSLWEGISVGWGDDYGPYVEGQSIDVTGLRDGVYVLVHNADDRGSIAELRRDNNVASARIRLRLRGAFPSVRVLRRCAASARCPAKPG